MIMNNHKNFRHRLSIDYQIMEALKHGTGTRNRIMETETETETETEHGIKYQ